MLANTTFDYSSESRRMWSIPIVEGHTKINVGAINKVRTRIASVGNITIDNELGSRC